MVNLKVLNAIINAKQTAITEDVYNLICREADTKYRYNIETIVKAMLLSLRTDDINSDKFQNARGILLNVLGDAKPDDIERKAYGVYFGDVSRFTLEEVSQNITDWWNCLYPASKRCKDTSDVIVERARLNAPADIVKRMNKQNYRKALCVAWADTYIRDDDPDPAEEWKRRYSYKPNTMIGQLLAR